MLEAPILTENKIEEGNAFIIKKIQTAIIDNSNHILDKNEIKGDIPLSLPNHYSESNDYNFFNISFKYFNF